MRKNGFTSSEKIKNSKILEREYFTPAIQQAVEKAVADKYRPLDIINGVANAYLTMLKCVFFRHSAVSGFLRAQAKYVDGLKKHSIH